MKKAGGIDGMISGKNIEQSHVCVGGSWIPLPPSIMPVVIVQGSDYEMGYQYGQQVGPYIELVKDAEWVDAFRQFQKRKEIQHELEAAEHYIRMYAPEEIRKMKGIAEGATKAGYKVSYADVLLINTRVHPPTPAATFPSHEESCSVWAAWGKTTIDGRLICGDSKDELYSYQVLTVAFPDRGNAYVMAAKAGEIGQHFAMNNKGLFIGASGAPGERDGDRDYGIPYSCTFPHLLQFSSHAEEAKEMLQSWKIYWCRGLNYTFADTRGRAFVVEMTAQARCLRLPGDHGETDFIYATNDFLTDVMKRETDGATYGLINSPPRNDQIFSLLTRYQGSVDVDFAKMMWRCPGYGKIGNLYNHRVVVALPDEGDKGVAYVCTGPPNQEAYPTYASGPGPYPGLSDSPERDGHDYLIAPTHSFYRIGLASCPEAVVEGTQEAAHDTNAMAYQALRRLKYTDSGYGVLNDLYSRSVAERFEGTLMFNKGLLGKGRKALSYLSYAATAFTRSQAHALQVYNALVPPVTDPKDLGHSSGERVQAFPKVK